MFSSLTALLLLLLTSTTLCIKYETDQVLWNLNQNQTATDPLDYWGQWGNHSKCLIYSSNVVADPIQHISHPQTTGDSHSTP